MSQPAKYQRKLYLIDKEFQFSYLATWLLLVLSLVGGMVLTTLTLFFFFRGSLFRYGIEINAALAVMFTGLSLYYMVHHSHRIAGPAYRLELVIRQIARGEYDLDRMVHLRRKDYLKHIAAALNELIETRAQERGHVRVLLAGMAELDSAVQSASGLSTEIKDLSRLLFAEVVDLAGSTETDADPTSAQTPLTNLVTAPGPVAEQSPSDPVMDGMGASVPNRSDDSDPGMMDEGSPVNEYRRAVRGCR